MISPKNKKARVEPINCGIKRNLSQVKQSIKRRKSSNFSPDEDETIFSLKRNNFVVACKQVSYKAYHNYAERFDLPSLPLCAKLACNHQYLNNNYVKQVHNRVDELIKIEMKSNIWNEALDISFLSIKKSLQYLSPNILKDIVEIILNAHEDLTGNHTITNLLLRCQEILSLHFSMFPPCTKIKSLRKCYTEFLTSPMVLRENTFTDRLKFESNKGVVNYTLNRLEAELHPDSNEGALLNRLENTPDEMTNNVQGLHWQKEKFEIFEMLNRTQRIERLMMILESAIELIQFDLTIWHSRYTNNLGSHIANPKNRPIMAVILWSKNILFTGSVTNITRQILRLFINFIHLQYPEKHIKTMTQWLNSVIQTFYICEKNSNSNYPNIGKKSSEFASTFYTMMTALPQTSILKILDRIQPSFMRYLISKQHIQSVLSSTEDEIITIFIDFIKNRQWEKFYGSKKDDVTDFKELNIKYSKHKVLSYLSKKCNQLLKDNILLLNKPTYLYPKMCINSTDVGIVTQNYVTYLLFIVLKSFLDSYSLQNVQETWDTLNDQLDQEILTNSSYQESNFYSISEYFVKKYRLFFQMLKELVKVLQDLKNFGMFPEIFNIFTTIHLLGM